uniref:(northern house mosquito) hypothetical protein n=1 Tax=Culex pipiens TaxID=7175 RepID=A0A8D8JAB5_CULPI
MAAATSSTLASNEGDCSSSPGSADDSGGEVGSSVAVAGAAASAAGLDAVMASSSTMTVVPFASSSSIVAKAVCFVLLCCLSSGFSPQQLIQIGSNPAFFRSHSLRQFITPLSPGGETTPFPLPPLPTLHCNCCLPIIITFH